MNPSAEKKKKIAVILSGCGNKDGSEITESVSIIVALSQAGAETTFFAPNLEFHPVNFLTNEKLQEKRNVLWESARISRGEIQELKSLRSKNFDGLVLPGGFGAALHLSNWAEKGAACSVLPEVQHTIENFFAEKKPIAAVCIAPAIVARVLGKHQISITLGPESEASDEVRKTGASHKACSSSEFVWDEKNKIFTSPAYMHSEARPAEIFEGISKMIHEFVNSIN